MLEVVGGGLPAVATAARWRRSSSYSWSKEFPFPIPQERCILAPEDRTERRAEGDAQGFPDSLNRFIRETWWPDEASEGLRGIGQDQRPQRWTKETVCVAPGRRKAGSVGAAAQSSSTSRTA